ncbi:cell division control protein 6 homolog B [Ipomoea triloba]|uniref:cell division control protein 6 homolog B n=1 Tax=Ipomoea triloba TaxID=35885 RepID=UPI00125D52C5|nr:cell division control protein 6 homolog B [Ipomoea triloba]
MTVLATRRSPRLAGGNKAADPVAVNVEMQVSTPQKRRFGSDSSLTNGLVSSTPLPVERSPAKLKSPRRCLIDSPSSPAKGIGENTGDKAVKMSKSPVKRRLMESFIEKPLWNSRDPEQLNAVKEALHVSTAPSTIMCRDAEQNRVLEFCKQCVEQGKAGSLYVSGCPGTGKSLSIEKVKEALVDWAKKVNFQQPDILTINCTSLTKTSEIFNKILEKIQPKKKLSGSTTPLQLLQNLFSLKQQAGTSMMLIIADELDYLITQDRAVLHDLFMLTTFPSSRCIVLGIANAIDLADRFLPKLQSLNCKPMVITFRAYSKDQIIMILRQRLAALPYIVFQPQALELCARKIASASGDMRKALSICRSAIEVLETEIRDSINSLNLTSLETGVSDAPCNILRMPDNNIVRVDHVARALSNAYKSPAVDTIQSLPQHQQIILCSAVKLFRGGKKDGTIGELSKYYIDVCRSTLVPAVGVMELSSMCRVLADQGLLKMGQSREVKLRRVTLKVDEADITFALQGIRFFRNCLQ